MTVNLGETDFCLFRVSILQMFLLIWLHFNLRPNFQDIRISKSKKLNVVIVDFRFQSYNSQYLISIVVI